METQRIECNLSSFQKRQFLARRLRAIRADFGYSQEYVANELNISRARLSRYENGETVPDYDLLVDLAWFYQVNLSYFFPVKVHGNTDL